jgi:hypothetical protein
MSDDAPTDDRWRPDPETMRPDADGSLERQPRDRARIQNGYLATSVRFAKTWDARGCALPGLSCPHRLVPRVFAPPGLVSSASEWTELDDRRAVNVDPVRPCAGSPQPALDNDRLVVLLERQAATWTHRVRRLVHASPPDRRSGSLARSGASPKGSRSTASPGAVSAPWEKYRNAIQSTRWAHASSNLASGSRRSM